jgi:hypothetical protein
MDDYYRLNYQRKPEHLQWWLPRETPRASPLSDAEIDARLVAFADLRARTDRVARQLSPEKRDAFEELVGYPVRGSALANLRYFSGERGAKEPALAADAELRETTHHFNDNVAGGKWRGLIALEPADDDWKSMRLARWQMPPFTRPPRMEPFTVNDRSTGIAAAGFDTNRAGGNGATWTVVPGLGRSGRAVTVLPAEAPAAANVSDAPQLRYSFTLPRAGEFTVQFHLLPTHPLRGADLRLAVSLDDETPQVVSLDVKDGGSEWAQGVLSAMRVATARLRLSASGSHTLHVYGIDAGVALDKIVIDCGGLTPSYLGPP